MIRTLPAESALVYEIHGEVARWDTTNYQMATLLDLVGMRWVGKKWKRVTRPTSKQKQADGMPVEEKRRRLARLQERHAARRARKAVSDG